MFFLALGDTSSLFNDMVNMGEQYGIDNPTESDVRRVVEAIASGEQDMAILVRKDDENTFIQSASGRKGRLLLEYQEGSLSEHYGILDPSATAEQIVNAMISYMRGESIWKTWFVWEKMKL